MLMATEDNKKEKQGGLMGQEVGGLRALLGWLHFKFHLQVLSAGGTGQGERKKLPSPQSSEFSRWRPIF